MNEEFSSKRWIYSRIDGVNVGGADYHFNRIFADGIVADVKVNRKQNDTGKIAWYNNK